MPTAPVSQSPPPQLPIVAPDSRDRWIFLLEKKYRLSAKEERRLIGDKIDEIIRDNEPPDLSGDGCCYYIISERVVDWCLVCAAA